MINSHKNSVVILNNSNLKRKLNKSRTDEKDKCIVFNVEQLFKDLPFMVNQVVKEQAKMQDWHLSRLKDELKEIKDESK